MENTFGPENRINYSSFVKKTCNEPRTGWLAKELKTFAKILELTSSGTKKELCKKIKHHLEFNIDNNFNWELTNDEANNTSNFQNVPAEIILEVLKHSDVNNIKRLCSKYPEFKKVCVNYKNSIAKDILDKLNIKFSSETTLTNIEILKMMDDADLFEKNVDFKYLLDKSILKDNASFELFELLYVNLSKEDFIFIIKNLLIDGEISHGRDYKTRNSIKLMKVCYYLIKLHPDFNSNFKSVMKNKFKELYHQVPDIYKQEYQELFNNKICSIVDCDGLLS